MTEILLKATFDPNTTTVYSAVARLVELQTGDPSVNCWFETQPKLLCSVLSTTLYPLLILL